MSKKFLNLLPLFNPHAKSGKYEIIGKFNEGLAPVRGSVLWGYINEKNEEVIPLKWDKAYAFQEGLALVEKDDKFGFIDSYGNTSIPFKFTGAFSFSEGIAQVKEGELWGIINKAGEFIILPRYAKMFPFTEGAAIVCNTESLLYGFIDRQGKEITPCCFCQALSYSEGMAAVALSIQGSCKWGYINKNGENILPFKYTTATSFLNGIAKVGSGNKTFYINQQGYEIR